MTPADNFPTSALSNSANGFHDLGAEAIRLLCGERRRVDVSEARRSLSEAMLAWPGVEGERWWKWLVETGRGLGYAARVIDASPREVFELLRHGVEAVTVGGRDGLDSSVFVLTEAKRKNLRLTELPGDLAGRWVSQRELSTLLGGTGETVRRWVVLDPMSDDVPLPSAESSTEQSHHNSEGHEAHSHRTPWSRLWDFLRPEASDLWIVFVFALLIGMLSLATPIAVEALVNTVAFGTMAQPLIVLSIILLTFLGFAAALRFLQRCTVELIQRRLFARVAARLAWQLPRVRLDHADEFTPELLNRFFDVVTMQKIVAMLALDGLKVVLTVLMGMVVLAFYHPWLLAFDAVLLVLIAINVLVLSRGALRTSIAESKSKYAVAGWLEDIARCPTTFKAGGAAEFALTRADRLTTDYLVARQAHFRVLMRQIICGLALEAMASAVLLGLGGFLVIEGQLTLGQLVAAELIVTYIVVSVAKLDKQFEGFYDLLTSMDKLGHLFDLPVESSSGVMHLGRTAAARVSLHGVSVSHRGGTPVLSELSFDAAADEVIAITGKPGCGKSTLFDLLFRLREPTSGRILLDDHDLSDLRPDVLRQNVSLVRAVEILEGTLAENVHLNRSDITNTDLREALRLVGLDENHSLDLRLAFDGKPLSESQARRLMLARALVARPRLLLIDGLLDPFSDDDAKWLMNQLKKLRTPCTLLIATGRRAIADQCDRKWEL